MNTDDKKQYKNFDDWVDEIIHEMFPLDYKGIAQQLQDEKEKKHLSHRMSKEYTVSGHTDMHVRICFTCGEAVICEE